MTNVVAFKPRPRPLEPAPLPAIDLRTHLEDAAQTALDAAEKIMAALDHIDSGEGAAPPLAATIVGHVETADQGALRFRYAKAPIGETVAPEPEVEDAQAEPHSGRQTSRVEAGPEPEAPTVALEDVEPEPIPEPIRLPWRGAGNVVSAAGCAIVAFMVGAA